METVKTRQRRSVYRCNSRPSPGCVGVDVGWGFDRSHQVQPTNEQGCPGEPPVNPSSSETHLNSPTVGRCRRGT